MRCPNDDTLRLLLDGTLTIDESQGWSEHVSACSACQQSLARLSDDDELRAWRDARSRQATSPDDDAACESLVSRALAGFRAESRDAADKDCGESLPIEPPSHPGDLGRLLHYRIEQEIGRGGMGVVVRAIDERLQRTVALKLLRSHLANSTGRARFVREAQAAARIHHPHVVAVHHVDNSADSPPFLVMEYVAGESLREHITNVSRVEPRQAAEWIAQAADGLAAAHAANLVHRDIKPANILLAPSDKGEFIAKVSDFGLARALDTDSNHASSTTTSGMWAGTPAYMSPEQIAHPDISTASADIYSLGVTLYECLTGNVPFRGSPAAVLRQVATDDPPSPRTLDDSLPRDLETICLKAMAKETGRRYSNANDFASDLRRWLRGEPITARPTGAVERLWRWGKRNPRVATLGATIVVLLAVIAAGSTIAAIRLEAARADLEKQTNAALDAGRRERAQAEIAASQSRVALDSLNQLIFRLQSELRDQPATLRTRQSLLEAALDGLANVTKHASDPTQSSHAYATAYLRMGDLLWLGGQPDRAAEQYTRAAEVARSAWKSKPDDVTARRDLALAEEMLGYLDQQAHRFDECRRRYDAALAHRTEMLAQHPDDPELIRDMYMTHNRIGDLESLLNRHPQSAARYQSALELLDRLAALPTGETPALAEQRAKTERRIGLACTALGQVQEAEDRYRKSLRAAMAGAEQHPDNVNIAREVLLTRTSLGNLYLGTERFSEAAEEHEHAANGLRKMTAAEPNHAELRWDLALSLNAWGNALRAADRCDDSLGVQVESLGQLDALTAEFPQAIKYRHTHFAVAYAVGELHLRAGRYADAVVAYARTQASIESLHKLVSDPDPLASWIERLVVNMRDVCTRLVEGDSPDRPPPSEDVRKLITLVRAYEAARAGRTEESLLSLDMLATQLPDAPLDRAMYLQTLARIAAINADRQSDDPLRDDRLRERARRWLAESRAASPALSIAIPLEPDLRSVR